MHLGPTTEESIRRVKSNTEADNVEKFRYYFFFTLIPEENSPNVRWGQVIESNNNTGRVILHDYTSGKKWEGTPAYILEETCKYGHPHLWHDGRKEKFCPWCDVDA